MDPFMAVSLRDARNQPEDRRWIESVYREYLDDLAPDASGVFPMLAETGHSEPDQLQRWFSDPRAALLTILRAGRQVGFAMIAREGVRIDDQTNVRYRMAEFFVARPMRRLGIGRSAVPLIFDRFAGHWQVSEHQHNGAAVGFWRRVVAHYTGGRYEERIHNGEVHQTFVTGSALRRAP